VVSGDVMLGSTLSRANLSEAVVLETVVFCLLYRGLLWCGMCGGVRLRTDAEWRDEMKDLGRIIAP